MKHALTLVFGLFLALSLAVYGTVGVAQVTDNAAFSMEICADGVTKTVFLDADGNPVEPAQTCAWCLTCCLAFGAFVDATWSPFMSLNLLDIAVMRPVSDTPILTKRNRYPAPRGPPGAQSYHLELIAFQRSVDGKMMRSDGRPMFKDANA